ncbi:hypothetical protein ACI797_21075 [Geodermatophilus sp. SYSU D00691]
MLPTRADRDRYYCELVAELYGTTPRDQLRFAVGVLSQAFALRAALGDPRQLLEEVPMPSFGRRFRCRVLRLHDWRLHSTEDGSRYRSCAVCGTDDAGPRGMTNTIGA